VIVAKRDLLYLVSHLTECCVVCGIDLISLIKCGIINYAVCMLIYNWTHLISEKQKKQNNLKQLLSVMYCSEND